ncbi:MAG: S8 family serine peptidase [Ilumatobacteraceae bacterium]
MKRRRLGAVLLLLTTLPLGLSFATAHRVAAQSPRTHDRSHTDPQLRAEVVEDGGRDSLISVEVLTADNASVERSINRLAGTVTGSVEGQLVQALVPASAVEQLASDSAVRYVQRPLRINRVPHQEAFGTGTVVGEEVQLTNASAWQDAGIMGNVRIGIIDFFDLRLWNASELGPAPDAAHQFCPDVTEGLCMGGQINPEMGDRHGIAVAEIVKDMAPGAELFVATTATTAQTQAAIDWFVLNGVHIVTRSLGAPYDGPGDGTGPLDAVVDYAAARGITWFNSAGNDAAFGYGRYTDGIDSSGYVDFLNGPGVDTMLRVDPQNGGVAFDGIRWANDWYLPPNAVTDYSVEVWQGNSESSATYLLTHDDPQTLGAPPLEIVDEFFNVSGAGQALFLRIRAGANYMPSAPDIVEVATFFGNIEPGRISIASSAAKPVVDSRNPSLLAVGAIDPANGSKGIAFYSSQGPTNDGRIKPDISAPSCVKSSVYAPNCFNGTSAASPAAAGIAALLLSRGLAEPGMPLAALTKHLVNDLGPTGPDNAYGAGVIHLPAPPPTIANSEPSAFTSLASPVRLLDTRKETLVGPAHLIGPHPQFAILDLPVSSTGGIPSTATAVAVNVTSTDASSQFYVQVLPTLGGSLGAFSTINVAAPGQIRPNFAIVPIGQGSISIFIPTGGNIIVDAMGYFTPSASTAAGRFVPINPRRALDTRPQQLGPVPAGWVAHRPTIGESVRVEVPPAIGLPTTGVSALVVNVTATESVGPGFLQAHPTGATRGQTSTVNYVATQNAATHAIVPLGSDGTISIFTSNSAHIVVDVMGYITDATSQISAAGRFVAITPARYYDSRIPPGAIHAGHSTVTIPFAGLPAGTAAISMNLTSDAAVGTGFVTAYPSDGSLPLTSSLNFTAATPVANAGLVKLSAGGSVNTYVNVATHVIIDANGYFTGTV